MRTGEMFDLALRCYQRLGWTYLRLTILPALFCLAAYLFEREIVLPSLFLTSNASNLNVQIGEAVTSVALGLFVGGPLFLMGLSWSTCVVAQLVSDTILGNVPSPAASVSTVRRAISRVFGVNLYEILIACIGFILATGLLILSGLLTRVTGNDNVIAGVVAIVGTLGEIAGVIVFLIVVARYALAPTIAIMEGVGLRESVRRSVLLQKTLGFHPSGGGTVIGLMFLSSFVFLLVVGGIGSTLELAGVSHFLNAFFSNIPFGSFLLEALRLLPTFLAIWTIVPFWAATLTILYYERRVRLEGYDIEALAADVWRTDLQARFEL